MDIWIFHGFFKFRRNLVGCSSNFVELSSKIRQLCVPFSEISSISFPNVRFQGPPEVVIPPSCARGGGLPPAVRQPQKKHAPGILKHVSCEFSRLSCEFNRFSLILVGFDVSLNN